jgi:hypothetical protein
MTNTPVPATATGLPNSRRAVLRSLLAGAAVATVPAAGALTAAGQPDAALFALRADIEAADRLKEASFGPLNVAEKAYFAAQAPKPVQPEGVSFTDEEWFLAFKEKMAELNAHQSPESAAYVAAVKAWVEDDNRIHEETGLTDAEAHCEELDADILALRDQIVATRATTLGGLKFKAKYAVDHYPGEPDQEVMDSIVDDILAMEG